MPGLERDPVSDPYQRPVGLSILAICRRQNACQCVLHDKKMLQPVRFGHDGSTYCSLKNGNTVLPCVLQLSWRPSLASSSCYCSTSYCRRAFCPVGHGMLVNQRPVSAGNTNSRSAICLVGHVIVMNQRPVNSGFTISRSAM